MNTRRAFLKAAALAAGAGALAGWDALAGAAGAKPLIVSDARIIRVRERKGGGTDSYLEIASDSGLKGYAGPLLKEQVAAFPANLREFLAGRDAADPEKLNFATLWAACHPGKSLETYVEGKDPLTGAAVWGIKRATRQTETGWVITALSAIDLALWDLRGKVAGQPVWRLLGAKRQRVNAYASMLGYSVKPDEARKAARTIFDQGFQRQKWFFMSGPADGAEGLKQNIAMAQALREEKGAAPVSGFMETGAVPFSGHGKGDSPLFATARKGYSPLWSTWSSRGFRFSIARPARWWPKRGRSPCRRSRGWGRHWMRRRWRECKGGETGLGNRGSRANQPPKEVVSRRVGGYHKCG